MANLDPATRQKLIDAYSVGDLDALNGLLGSTGGAPAAASAGPEPMFFDPNAGKQQAPAPQAPASSEPMFFDPNGGQEGGEQAEPEQQFATNGFMGGGGTGAAALNKFAETATFGLAPKAQAGLLALYGKARYGIPFGQAYDAANELVEQRDEQLAAAHPYGNAAGMVGGILGGGKLLGGVMEATPGLRALVPVEGGSKLANFGREATVAGGVSAGEEALKGGTPGQVALAGGAGAIAGPIIGATVGKVAGAVGSRLSKGWRYLAKKVDIDPDVLASYLAANPGSRVADVLTARQSGALRQFAEKNPIGGEILQGAQREAEAALPGKVSSAVEDALGNPARPKFLQGINAKTLSPNSIATAKDEAMDAAVGAIENDTVQVPASLVREATFNKGVPYAMREDIAKGMKGIDPDDPNATVPMTIRQVDTVRRRLRRLQKSPANVGEDFGDFADDLRDIAAKQHAAYGEALEEYGKASRFESGFGHGYGGGVKESVGSGASGDLRRALESQEGEAGRRAGYVLNLRNKAAGSAHGARKVAEEVSSHTSSTQAAQAAVGSPQASDQLRSRAGIIRQADNALNAATPGALRNVEDEGGNALGHVAFGAAQAATGMAHSGGYRVLHGLQNFLSSSRFSPQVQRAIMEGVTSTNPNVQRQTLAALRSAIADQQANRALQIGAGAVGGATVGNTLFPGGAQ